MTATLAELETPALLVDLDALEANLAEMAAVAARAGVRLRPHTKTHKSPEIAHMQVAAGAAGITCAKLGEAEVMADAGLDDLLIAYPLVGEAKLGRLGGLLDFASDNVVHVAVFACMLCIACMTCMTGMACSGSSVRFAMNTPGTVYSCPLSSEKCTCQRSSRPGAEYSTRIASGCPPLRVPLFMIATRG